MVIDLVPLEFSEKDRKFLEARRVLQQLMCAAFGVPEMGPSPPVSITTTQRIMRILKERTRTREGDQQ